MALAEMYHVAVGSVQLKRVNVLSRPAKWLKISAADFTGSRPTLDSHLSTSLWPDEVHEPILPKENFPKC